MASLFFSHASKDDALAKQLESWLKDNGFTDLFVDHSHIRGGENWKAALKKSAHSARVVIFLVTPSWLASSECSAEFDAAWYMGKRLIPLFLLPDNEALDETAKTRLRKVRGEDQGFDISACVDANGAVDFAYDDNIAQRLRDGLRAGGANTLVGLDPEAFDIDTSTDATPFPGLASFGDDDTDAAIFYGRSREIGDILQKLRAMRATGGKSPLMILGASAAGKSSILKAGVIPRLRREKPAWIAMRAFRPGANPLLNFAEALERTYADFRAKEAYGPLRDRLFEAWETATRDPATNALTAAGRDTLVATIEAEGARLRQLANQPGASILVSIDQAEELARAEGASGDALADYLRAALETNASDWQLAFTIRTDSFSELQKHARFQNLETEGYDLRPVPKFRFDNVVEQPAARFGVEVDPNMIDRLMEDAPEEDALPLLAFAMQRLWGPYAGSGRLTEQNYTREGGLDGLINHAAECALRGIAPDQDVPKNMRPLTDSKAKLGASTFVPPLVQINDKGAAIREVAQWTDFDAEQQELLDSFDRWRLIVHKHEDKTAEAHEITVETTARTDINVWRGTVEVAHETLFRKWERLKGWLEPERARLEALRGVQVAANAWNRNKRSQSYLTHWGRRLAEAGGLQRDARFAKRLKDYEQAYLAASQRAERAANWRSRLGYTALAVLLTIAVAGWQHKEPLGQQAFYYRNFWERANTDEQVAALKPGEQFMDCRETNLDKWYSEFCPTMVVIPAGKFMMGNPGRQREVTITKPFAVSKFEITFDQWQTCVALGGCIDNKNPLDQGWGRGNRPIVNVSWDGAVQYAEWLSKTTGQRYRLLTEAEWEYAARAGTTGDFSFEGGEEKLGEYAWYGENSGLKTHPVGGKKPNAFGLYDMHGNVWEWVNDWYGDYESGSQTDPQGPSTGQVRVIRGGGWGYGARSLRSAGRFSGTPVNRSSVLGFRLARTYD